MLKSNIIYLIVWALSLMAMYFYIGKQYDVADFYIVAKFLSYPYAAILIIANFIYYVEEKEV